MYMFTKEEELTVTEWSTTSADVQIFNLIFVIWMLN